MGRLWKTIRLAALLLVFLPLGVVVRAADAPAEPLAPEEAWANTVASFAAVLAGEADPAELANLLADGATARAFDRDLLEPPAEMLTRLPARQLVSKRAYLQPAVSAASDLIADVKAFGALPAVITGQLLIEDPGQLRQADATMARWFGLALDADGGEPVALVVLYHDGNSDVVAGRVATQPRLWFVLVKGIFRADGSARITRILYGDMTQATN